MNWHKTKITDFSYDLIGKLLLISLTFLTEKIMRFLF